MEKIVDQNQMNGCTNSTNVKKFFDQEWDLYKKVVKLNYMAHKEILEVLRKLFRSVPPPVFSVLELGCGDASLLGSALQGTGISAYCGVDISHYALEIAEKNMQLHQCDKRFIECDLLEGVGRFGAEFDVIVAGFSLHHLMNEEKGHFFEKCCAALKSRGTLIIFDEVCYPGENRNGFFERFSGICLQEWNKLTNDEKLRIFDHVKNNDYPETFEFYKQLAEGHGFKGSQMLFQDKRKLYGILSFST